MELHKRAQERANQLGISFAEYVRRLLARDLGETVAGVGPEAVFDLGSSGGSDIAGAKDEALARALADERGLLAREP
jgi:hypothetical protein